MAQPATIAAAAGDPATMSYNVEDFTYPGAAQIEQQQGIKLKRGNGQLVLVDCAQPWDVMVESRIQGGRNYCFDALGPNGFLALEIGDAYAIWTEGTSVQAKLTAEGKTTTVDVPKDAVKPVGETDKPNGAMRSVLVELRITGGGTTNPQAPSGDKTLAFTGRVTVGDKRACTATLVDPLWVLTAKHCFADNPADTSTVTAGVPKDKTTVTVGRTDLATSGGHTTDIVELVPHADRALVMARLATPATNVTPVKLSTAAPSAGETLTVVGFGRTRTEWVPSKLHSAAFTVGAPAGTGFPITAKAPTDATVCQGDAGGPAVRTENGKPALVGITGRSWENGCLGSSTQTTTGAADIRTTDLTAWISAQASRSFVIRNAASGRCFNLSGAGPNWDNLTPVILFDCTLGTANEKFQMTADGLIRNPISGRCLNIKGAGPNWENLAPVILFDCTPGAANETFEWTADGLIRNPASGRCLNVKGAGPNWENLTEVILFDCDPNAANEKFQVLSENEVPHPVGQLRNPASGRCLNIKGAGPNWENLAPVILFDCTPGANNEAFQLTADGLIRNPVSGRCLNISGAGGENLTPIILFDCDANAANEKFEWTADDQLRNPASGRCLNISGAGPNWGNGTPIILFDCDANAANEKFKLSA